MFTKNRQTLLFVLLFVGLILTACAIITSEPKDTLTPEYSTTPTYKPSPTPTIPPEEEEIILTGLRSSEWEEQKTSLEYLCERCQYPSDRVIEEFRLFLLKSKPEIKIRIVETLGDVWAGPGTCLDKRVFGAIISVFGEGKLLKEPLEVKKAVMFAMSYSRDPRAFNLVEGMLKDSNLDIRLIALGRLSFFLNFRNEHREKVFDVWRNTLEDPSAEMRIATIQYMEGVDQEGIDLVSDLAIHDPEPEVRVEAMEFLRRLVLSEKIGKEELMPCVLASMEDSNLQVRHKGFSCLRTLMKSDELESSEAASYGIETLNDPDPDIRYLAHLYLISLGVSGTEEPMIAALQEERRENGERIAYCFYKSGHEPLIVACNKWTASHGYNLSANYNPREDPIWGKAILGCPLPF